MRQISKECFKYLGQMERILTVSTCFEIGTVLLINKAKHEGGLEMKLCYQVATPDVAIADSVTAYQGSLEKSFGDLGRLGYDGVELMTLNPEKLDWNEVKETAEKNGLSVILVCTGEIFGQLGLSYTHPHRSLRREAVERTKEIIDFAGYLGANVNIGRIRGQYCRELDREERLVYTLVVGRMLETFMPPCKVEYTTVEAVCAARKFRIRTYRILEAGWLGIFQRERLVRGRQRLCPVPPDFFGRRSCR